MEEKEIQKYLAFLECPKFIRTFNGLTWVFEMRYEKSLNKDALYSKEIEGFELVFDDKNLPIIEPTCCRPFKKKYLINFSDWDIYVIREYYYHFIVEPNNINNVDVSFWLRD